MNYLGTDREKLHRVTGEFVDAKLEQEFLADAWPRIAMQLRIVIGITLLMTLLMIVAAFFDGKPETLGFVFYLRLLQAYLVGMILWRLRDGYVSRALEISILLAEVAVVLVEAGDFFQPLIYHNRVPDSDLPFAVLFVFLMYLLIPNRFSYTIFVGVFAGVLFSALSFGLYEDSSGEAIYMALKFLFLNIMAGGYGSFVNRLRRRDYVQRLALEREIEQRQLAQQHAIEAQDLAERASEDKSRFVAAASHDLRQPLHALGFFIDALDEAIREGRHQDVLERVKQSRDNLNSLIEAILDISRLDAGNLEVNQQPTHLQPLLDELEALATALTESNDTRVRIRPCSLTVQTDPILLERMLSNLLENAAKYAEGGNILVACRRREGKLCIEVRDNGIGIAEEQLGRIFDEFRQVDNPERSLRKGLGLGLAIVKRLADLLDHRLEVRSEYGRGSCFSITLPLSTAKATDSSPTLNRSPLALAGARVLVVEDDQDVMSATLSLLNNWGCQCIGCANADDAMTITIGDGPINLLISDYRLPGQLNGLQLIETLRRDHGIRCPALVVTGDLDPDIEVAVEAAGVRIMYKPLKPARLRATLSEMLEEAVA